MLTRMTTTVFSDVQFMADAAALATALDAPYQEDSTRKVLEVYGSHFQTGAVLWKTTDRPGDRLYYRFFARERTNTVDTALSAGLIRPSILTEIVAQWSDKLGPEMIESCDFDLADGLAKTWVYLGGMRPAELVLDVPALAAVGKNLPALLKVGLSHVRFAAVDYRSSTINVYFRGRGPLTQERATEVLAAVGIDAPDETSTVHMAEVMPTDFCLAVTFAVDTGVARRACFYSLGIPETNIPPIPERIATFFKAAPCQDEEVIRALGWSYGTVGQSYIKAEHAYCGDMAARLRDWDCYLAGSDQRDPILEAAFGPTQSIDQPTVQVITPELAYEGKQKMGMVAGVCTQTVGSQALCMHLAEMPPRSRGKVHIHDQHETSLYVTEGCTRTYFGPNLEHYVDSKAGELLYIPASMPHLAVNLMSEPAKGVLARTDPNEQESVRLLPHLEDKAELVFTADLARESAEVHGTDSVTN
jgi:4-hydroxyphenylpyruvate 3-dimethylallyltransferase